MCLLPSRMGDGDGGERDNVAVSREMSRRNFDVWPFGDGKFAFVV